MKIDILTLFPEMFVPLKTSILKRAQDKNLIEINIINFRDFSKLMFLCISIKNVSPPNLNEVSLCKC